MSKQHSKFEKRSRRKAYLERQKEKVRAAIAAEKKK